MHAILLFSHGSVLCGAEQNLLRLATEMRERGDAPIVEAGFLNYCEPRFDTAVERCIGQGATQITIAPYFLVEGKFVVQDLPVCIAEAKQRHPEIEFVTAGVIGFHERLVDAILESAADPHEPAHWRAGAREAAQWCRETPKCPLYGRVPCRVQESS